MNPPPSILVRGFFINHLIGFQCVYVAPGFCLYACDLFGCPTHPLALTVIILPLLSIYLGGTLSVHVPSTFSNP
jgi:hypothetical protein